MITANTTGRANALKIAEWAKTKDIDVIFLQEHWVLEAHVQQLVDMAGELSIRVQESEYDARTMGAIGGSYFEREERPRRLSVESLGGE